MTQAIVAAFVSLSGSSLTTIAGFLALCFMRLTLGRDIGLVMAKGVVLERRPVAAGIATGSPAYVRLQNVAKELEALVGRSRGRPNKDLAQLANQLKQQKKKWDA